MADRFEQRSIGGGFVARMAEMLASDEARKRQQLLDGIEIQNQQMARQRLEMEIERNRVAAERQARQDEQNEADRFAALNDPNTDISPKTADLLRRAGYGVTERQSLPATFGAGDQTLGIVASAAPTQAYSRRNETNSERLGREQREQGQRDKQEERDWRDSQADATRAFNVSRTK